MTRTKKTKRRLDPYSQTDLNVTTRNTASSRDTVSGRHTNSNFNSSTSYAAARTTLNLSINLYNNDSSQEGEEEEDNDDKKPAARQDMQESGRTNEQAIPIDDSSQEGEEEEDDDDDRKPAARQDMQEFSQAIFFDDSIEVDETPESPPHQRPRYSNHSMRARSRGRRDNSASRGPTNSTSRASGPKRASSQEVIDLTNSPKKPLADNQTEWACTRCTLLNAHSDDLCDACSFPRPDAQNDSQVRNTWSPDPSFRDQLTDPTSTSSMRSTARNRVHVESSMSRGAIPRGVASISRNNNSSRSSRRSSNSSVRTTRSARGNRNDTDRVQDITTEPNRSELPESVLRLRLGSHLRLSTVLGPRLVRIDGSLSPYRVERLEEQGIEVHVIRREMRYETLLQLPESRSTDPEVIRSLSESRSTDPEVIRSLPSFTIKDVEKEVPTDRRQCCICLGDFENGQRRKTLQCGHGFHEECIDPWLNESRKCPLCKFDVQGSI